MALDRDTENRIVASAIVALSLYALLRLEAIFPLIQDTDWLVHRYDLDAFLKDNPNGILGMIPSFTYHERCSECVAPLKAEIGKLSDPMLSSGFVFAFLGLWMSLWLERLYGAMSTQLRGEGVVRWNAEDDAAIEVRRRILSRSVALVVAALLLFGFLFHQFEGLPKTGEDWEFMLSAVALAALAGHRLGASAAYGTVGWRLNQPGRAVTLIVGHADGAGGARRVGEFLAFQGVLISIPILWLTFWLALIWNYAPFAWLYDQWGVTHLALLIVALLVCWIGFIRPLMVFSTHYRAAKREITEAWIDKTQGAIERSQDSYRKAKTWEEAQEAIEACEALTETSGKIAGLSSIPLRPAVRGIFSLATVFPVVTFVVELAAGSDAGLVPFIGKVIGGLAGLLS